MSDESIMPERSQLIIYESSPQTSRRTGMHAYTTYGHPVLYMGKRPSVTDRPVLSPADAKAKAEVEDFVNRHMKRG